MELTASNRRLTLTICFNYGGRAEIIDAVRQLVADGVPADKIDEKALRSRLYWPDMPDPDVVIRTSGEFRISNFLLWELALLRARLHRRPLARLPPGEPVRCRRRVPAPRPALRRGRTVSDESATPFRIRDHIGVISGLLLGFVAFSFVVVARGHRATKPAVTLLVVVVVGIGLIAARDADAGLTGEVATYRDEGVVLRTIRLGEADRIVTLATPEHGKVRAVAKGIRKTKSRLSGRLEPLTHVNMMCWRGRELDVVNQVEVIEHFKAIREDLDRVPVAMTMLEVVDHVALERQPMAEMFRDARGGAAHLGASGPRRRCSARFFWKLLALEGVGPSLELCAGCGSRPSSSPSTPGRAGSSADPAGAARPSAPRPWT